MFQRQAAVDYPKAECLLKTNKQMAKPKIVSYYVALASLELLADQVGLELRDSLTYVAQANLIDGTPPALAS